MKLIDRLTAQKVTDKYRTAEDFQRLYTKVQQEPTAHECYHGVNWSLLIEANWAPWVLLTI